jgi:SAM-dependent methyltransferase
VETIGQIYGHAPLEILDLGSGPGATAAAMANAGHRVTAVEFASSRAAFARELADGVRIGSLVVMEEDFYTVQLEKKYKLVTCWDGFGVGTDDDQRRLLKRISTEWLVRDGSALIEIFNPFKAAREAGTEQRLAPLENVPGSVAMTNRYFYDPVTSRWIDEWDPVDHPEDTLAQTLRCYSPVDLVLLLEGTGLKLAKMFQDGKEISFSDQRIHKESAVLNDWEYLVQLTKA